MLLVRMVQERQLQRLMGCHATLLDHDDLRTDAEREQVGSFFTNFRTSTTSGDEISPADQLNDAHSMLEEVRALEAPGLWTFALRRTETVKAPDGELMDWDVSTVVVHRRDNPAIIR